MAGNTHRQDGAQKQRRQHREAADVPNAGDDVRVDEATYHEPGEIGRTADAYQKVAEAESGRPQGQQGELHAVAHQQQGSRQ